MRISEKSGAARQMTTPRIPPSRTRRFEPRPSIIQGMLLLRQSSEHVGEIVLIGWFDVNIRGTADAQGGAFRERLVLADHGRTAEPLREQREDFARKSLRFCHSHPCLNFKTPVWVSGCVSASGPRNRAAAIWSAASG